MVVEIEVTNPAVGQNDVGIKDFAGLGVNTTGSDRGTNVIVQPADKVVPNIFGIFFHVLFRRSVLVFDNNRINDSDFLERFVPVTHTGLDPATVSNWGSVFNVETDRSLGWAEL